MPPKPAAFAEPIYVTRPLFPSLDIYRELLEGVWERQWLTNKGQLHDELERALCARLGVSHLSLIVNGTLGLTLACRGLGLSGEVVTTPFTSPATVNAIHWAGLEPVFADIDPVRLTIDPHKVEQAITPRTSAILGVHIYGIACEVEALAALAGRRGLRLVYDGAHTFGTTVGGRNLLDFGDASVLSFHATKLFNTAEGGAVITRDEALKRRVDLLRTLGIQDEFNVPLAGINARMNELAAALGLANLAGVEQERAGRAAVAAVYRERLGDLPGVSIVAPPPENSESRFYFVVRIDRELVPIPAETLSDRLKTFNVFTRRYFFPLCSEMPAYAGLASSAAQNLPVAMRVSREILALPMYAGLGANGAHRVCDIVHYILSESIA